MGRAGVLVVPEDKALNGDRYPVAEIRHRRRHRRAAGNCYVAVVGCGRTRPASRHPIMVNLNMDSRIETVRVSDKEQIASAVAKSVWPTIAVNVRIKRSIIDRVELGRAILGLVATQIDPRNLDQRWLCLAIDVDYGARRA